MINPGIYEDDKDEKKWNEFMNMVTNEFQKKKEKELNMNIIKQFTQDIQKIEKNDFYNAIECTFDKKKYNVKEIPINPNIFFCSCRRYVKTHGLLQNNSIHKHEKFYWLINKMKNFIKFMYDIKMKTIENTHIRGYKYEYESENLIITYIQNQEMKIENMHKNMKIGGKQYDYIVICDKCIYIFECKSNAYDINIAYDKLHIKMTKTDEELIKNIDGSQKQIRCMIILSNNKMIMKMPMNIMRHISEFIVYNGQHTLYDEKLKKKLYEVIINKYNNIYSQLFCFKQIKQNIIVLNI